MTLPIIERPLYGEVLIETSPWTTPFVWTDQTAKLVNGVNYSQGGRQGVPGSSPVDVGTLTATFKDLTTTPGVGSLVRISFSRVAGYAFVGYVQDVGQRVVFDNSQSLNTPSTLTTLYCVDWVGYVSQFQLVGVGGNDPTTGAYSSGSVYTWDERIAAINKIVDPAFATKIVSAVTSGTVLEMGDTDVVADISEHLDLVSNTVGAYWYPRNVIPTNTTTGRTGLVEVRSLGSLVSSGYTFTDVLGTSGQLHYTEIDLENSSQNVANTIVVNNRTRINISVPEITKIGGFNEENYVVVNNQNVVGVALDSVQKASDSTSITTYGNRQTEIYTNRAFDNFESNFIANPSVEYSDDGYGGIAASRVRRRKPLEDANPFSAFVGEWAMRSRIITASGNHRILYSGGESDGIPVMAGQTYYFKARAARGVASSSNTQAQARIRFYDDSETELLLSAGSVVNLTANNTWYQVSHSVTSPANSVRASVEIVYTRSSGANFVVGDRYWGDAFQLDRSAAVGFFDGDTQWTNQYGYMWTGGVGLSPSFRFSNTLDEIATDFLADYATTSLRVSRIRWNAQEKLTAVPSLTVGKTISVVYDGTTTTYRIVGVDGNIDPERYMIDLYLVKV